MRVDLEKCVFGVECGIEANLKNAEQSKAPKYKRGAQTDRLVNGVVQIYPETSIENQTYRPATGRPPSSSGIRNVKKYFFNSKHSSHHPR